MVRNGKMTLNFSISELTHSETANKFRINNTPNMQALDNLLNLIFYVLQPLRDKLGKPIIVTSGFRCQKLNQAVGGVPNSQHLTGQAVDIVVNGMTIDQLIQFIRLSDIRYDQLIHEGQWVHISYNHGKNRMQYIKM